MLQNIVAFSEYMNFNYVATLNENTAKKSYRITLEILGLPRRFSVLLSTVFWRLVSFFAAELRAALEVFDTKKSLFFLFSDKKFVALKVVKSAAHYTETALDEIKLLKCVSGIYFTYLNISECFLMEFYVWHSSEFVG